MSDTDPHPVVRVYELDPVTRSYGLTGTFHGHIKVTAPFDIEIDISMDALDRL